MCLGKTLINKLLRTFQYAPGRYWLFIDIVLLIYQIIILPHVFEGLKNVVNGELDPLLGNLFLFVFAIEFTGWLVVSKIPLPRNSRKNLFMTDIFIWICHIACDMVMVFWGLQALGFPISEDPETPFAEIFFVSFFLVVIKSLFWLFRLIALDNLENKVIKEDQQLSTDWKRIGAEICMGLYSIMAFTGIWCVMAIHPLELTGQPVLDLLYGFSAIILFGISFIGSRAWYLIIQLRTSTLPRILLPLILVPAINIMVGLIYLVLVNTHI
jgi:hypothetical protein